MHEDDDEIIFRDGFSVQCRRRLSSAPVRAVSGIAPLHSARTWIARFNFGMNTNTLSSFNWTPRPAWGGRGGARSAHQSIYPLLAIEMSCSERGNKLASAVAGFRAPRAPGLRIAGLYRASVSLGTFLGTSFTFTCLLDHDLLKPPSQLHTPKHQQHEAECPPAQPPPAATGRSRLRGRPAPQRGTQRRSRIT